MSSSNYIEKDILPAVDIAVTLENVNKCFHIYDKPHHRLLQGLFRGKKTFHKEFWAIQDVSFEIPKGQTVGIIGRNGAGKSTLLQILAGTLAQTSGVVDIRGRVTALLELGAGFNPEFTGIENIYLNGAIYGLNSQEIDAKFDEIVSFADIGEFISQPVKTYSSGMYVRLAFAIQASLEPDIFIVDEALAVGDASFVHKCMTRFQNLRDNGTTILLVTHDATAVRTLCERAIWLDKGVVRLDGQPAGIVDKYLASSRNQPSVNTSKTSTKIPQAVDEQESYIVGSIETEIPNEDQKYGDQSCNITGAALYDDKKRKVSIVSNNTEVLFRISFRNNSLDEGYPLIIGYSLRNHRGIDIASNNSMMEGFEILAPAHGEIRTINIFLRLPLLHPGSYAFTASINYRGSDGNMNNADTLSNLIVFEMISEKDIHVLMSLETRFDID